MGVLDGQRANQSTFNSAFVARNNDTDTSGVVTLKNTANVNSGAQVDNAQRAINELEDAVGMDGEGDTTRKDYSSQKVVTNGDDRKVAIGKLDAKFAGIGGHAHTGVDGDGDLIAGSSVTNVPLQGFWKQGGSAIGALSGQTHTNISSIMGGAARSSNSTTEGVCVDAVFSRCILRNADTGKKIVDSLGNTVYGVITYFASVWSMFYNSEIAGVETAYTLTGNTNIKFYYQFLHKKLIDDVYTDVYSLAAYTETTNPTDDVLTMVGDSGSGGVKGLVPAPSAGDAAAGKFLKADGTFKAPLGTETSFTVANNQSSAADVTGLLFDGSAVRSFETTYYVYRKTTSTGATELAETGKMIGVYSSVAATWEIGFLGVVGNAGVTFSITNLGQVQYVSTNITGTANTSKMHFRSTTMGV